MTSISSLLNILEREVLKNSKPTVIMNKGNGRYGFDSIDFLSSINTDHQSVGPGSNDYPTDEYADIKYVNKIYRCKTINFPDNMKY